MLLIISIQYIPFIPTRQSQNDLFVNTTQCSIRFYRCNGTNLWNSFHVSTDVKGIKPVSRFRQNIKNCMIDDYNSVINSRRFYDYIILKYYSLVCEVMLFMWNSYFVTVFLLLVFLFWVTCSASSMNYLGVPNSTQSTENCNNFISFSHFLFLNWKPLNCKYENILKESIILLVLPGKATNILKAKDRNWLG